MPALPDFVEPLSHGIYAIDTGFHRPRYDAAYLMVEGSHAAFIDTGTNHSVPRLLQALDALGLSPADVDAVIPTHVHLDHAGGVGLLMQSLPRATVWVHERGARHLIDPEVLVQGALELYGQAEMDRSYGSVVPVAAGRVQTTHDGQTINLGPRPLHIIDTPGHARHHHCIWDEACRGWFTGDTFGLSYRELDHPTHGAWVVPASTPVQFEPDALRTSIARLMAFKPACMHVTHYGRVTGVDRAATLLLHLLDEMVAVGTSLVAAPNRHEVIKAALATTYATSLSAHGMEHIDVPAFLAPDIELNAAGLGVWLDRQARHAAPRITPAPHG